MFLNLRIAVKSLATHKLRAALAMVGVFLGALAFTAVQHVTQSLELKAEQEAAKLGPNLFAAVAGQIRFSRDGSFRAGSAKRNFTLADALALRHGLPQATDAAPFISARMQLRSEQAAVQAALVATWPQYTEIRNFRPEHGRFFTWEEEQGLQRVMVLGRSIAERLFTVPEQALGGTVYLFRSAFRVVGVMQAKGRDLSGDNQDEQVFVPLSTYMRRAANQDWIGGVYLSLSPENAQGPGLEEAREEARRILRSRHHLDTGEADDFSLLTARDAMAVQRQALDLVGTLGAITASVSFGVGGMGILSIMVLMVRARRMEIGIRRAVGGRRRDVVRQFLFESGLMAVGGGLLGVFTSIGIQGLVTAFGSLPFVLDPLLLLFALAGSAGLGLLAGAYPAWQAAHVEILEVLKD